MWETLEVLMRHHRGERQREISARGTPRKTVRASIRAAEEPAWSKEVAPDETLTSRVVEQRKPGPASPAEEAVTPVFRFLTLGLAGTRVRAHP